MNLEDTENELPNPFVTTIPLSTETCDLSTIIEETEYDDDDQTSEYVSEVEFRQLDEDKQSGEDDVSDEEIEITFEPGALDNKYMEIKETIRLQESPFTTLEEIPRWRKDGMYLLLDNSSNIEKEKWKEFFGKDIWDDSGAWKNVRSPIKYFLHTNCRLRTIVKQKEAFCIEKQVNNKIFLYHWNRSQV